MNIPISFFRDDKVNFEQEINEKIVAFRDLHQTEMEYLMNKHKKFYLLRLYQPLIIIICILYVSIMTYILIRFIYDPRFLILIIIPPLLLFKTLRDENNTFKDVHLPVIKSVGWLKTHEKKNRKRTIKYFTVENVKFNNDKENSEAIMIIFSIYGKNTSQYPVRIEYSPNTKIIWNIKRRTTDHEKWETIYTKFIISDEIKKELTASSQN